MIAAVRTYRIYRVLMLLYLGAVALLCFANLGGMEAQAELWGMPTDKLTHICLFFPFPLLAWGCARQRVTSVPSILLRLCIIFLLGFLLGFGTEFIQGYLPNRSRESMDLLADLCGITASCLGITILKFCAQREG